MPYPYCTKADILTEISEEELIGLTDDESAGVVNDVRVTAAIAKADGEIDSYCGAVTEVPFTTIPPIIKEKSKTIAIYYLYGRRSAIPETRKKNYDDTVAWLELVAEGKVSIGTVAAADVTGGNEVSVSSGERIFTRDKMKGF